MTRTRLLPTTLAALALAAVLPGSARAQSTGKVAYVAVQAVMQRAPGYAQADSIWTQEAEGYRRELTQLQSRMDSASAAFDQQSVMLSAANRAAEQKKLQTQAQALQQRAAELQQKAQDRQKELLDPIEQRVMAIIEGLRAEGNYAIIFDVSANGGNIVAADKSLDLTQKAIDRLSAAGGTPGNE